MVKIAGEIRPGNQGGLQEQFFEWFERAVVDQLLAAAGESILLLEVPGRFLGDIVTDDLDLARVAYPQA